MVDNSLNDSRKVGNKSNKDFDLQSKVDKEKLKYNKSKIESIQHRCASFIQFLIDKGLLEESIQEELKSILDEYSLNVNQYVTVVEKSILFNYSNATQRLHELEKAFENTQKTLNNMNEKIDTVKLQENNFQQQKLDDSLVILSEDPLKENELVNVKCERSMETPKTPAAEKSYHQITNLNNNFTGIDKTPKGSNKSNQPQSASKEIKKINEYFATAKAEPLSHSPKKDTLLTDAFETQFQPKDDTNVEVIYNMLHSDLAKAKIAKKDFIKHGLQLPYQAFYDTFRKPFKEYSAYSGAALNRINLIVKWLNDKNRIQNLLDTIDAAKSDQKSTRFNGKKRKLECKENVRSSLDDELNLEQLQELEKAYKTSPYPTESLVEQLSEKLELGFETIYDWFYRKNEMCELIE